MKKIISLPLIAFCLSFSSQVAFAGSNALGQAEPQAIKANASDCPVGCCPSGCSVECCCSDATAATAASGCCSSDCTSGCCDSGNCSSGCCAASYTPTVNSSSSCCELDACASGCSPSSCTLGCCTSSQSSSSDKSSSCCELDACASGCSPSSCTSGCCTSSKSSSSDKSSSCCELDACASGCSPSSCTSGCCTSSQTPLSYSSPSGDCGSGCTLGCCVNKAKDQLKNSTESSGPQGPAGSPSCNYGSSKQIKSGHALGQKSPISRSYNHTFQGRGQVLANDKANLRISRYHQKGPQKYGHTQTIDPRYTSRGMDHEMITRIRHLEQVIEKLLYRLDTLEGFAKRRAHLKGQSHRGAILGGSVKMEKGRHYAEGKRGYMEKSMMAPKHAHGEKLKRVSHLIRQAVFLAAELSPKEQAYLRDQLHRKLAGAKMKDLNLKVRLDRLHKKSDGMKGAPGFKGQSHDGTMLGEGTFLFGELSSEDQDYLRGQLRQKLHEAKIKAEKGSFLFAELSSEDQAHLRGQLHQKLDGAKIKIKVLHQSDGMKGAPGFKGQSHDGTMLGEGTFLFGELSSEDQAHLRGQLHQKLDGAKIKIKVLHQSDGMKGAPGCKSCIGKKHRK